MAQNDKKIPELNETQFANADDYTIINHNDESKKIKIKNLHKNVVTVNNITNLDTILPGDIPAGSETFVLVNVGDKIYKIDAIDLGVKGDTGTTGPTGPKGDNGLNLISGIENTGSLPATGNTGDAVIVGDKIYIWDGTQWKPVDVNGVQGPTGPQGPQGPKGDSGLNFLGGVTGSTSGQLPATGNTGDTVIIGDTIYIWDGTQWQPIKVSGVMGPTGPAGKDGINGTTSYTNLNKTKVQLGGVPAGTSFDDVKLTDVLDSLFYGSSGDTEDVDNPIYGDMATPEEITTGNAFTYYFGELGIIGARTFAEMTEPRLKSLLSTNGTNGNLITFANRTKLRSSYSINSRLENYYNWYVMLVPNEKKDAILNFHWLTLDDVSTKHNLETAETGTLTLNGKTYYYSAFKNIPSLPVKFVSADDLENLL